jgi:hypothetical protein
MIPELLLAELLSKETEILIGVSFFGSRSPRSVRNNANAGDMFAIQERGFYCDCDLSIPSAKATEWLPLDRLAQIRSYELDVKRLFSIWADPGLYRTPWHSPTKQNRLAVVSSITERFSSDDQTIGDKCDEGCDFGQGGRNEFSHGPTAFRRSGLNIFPLTARAGFSIKHFPFSHDRFPIL